MHIHTLAAFLLSAPIAALAVDCSASRPEAFAPFFDRFSSEPAFALSRTVFPLQVLKWEYGLDSGGKDVSAPVKSLLSRDAFAQQSALKNYWADNGLQARIKKVAPAAAAVEVSKDSSDWLVSYRFKIKSGCWYLWQYEDQSL